MSYYEDFITMLDFTLDTKRKRHIVGGMLMSISLLFGGLALTAITLNREEKE
ncbi:MAG: histidine kinase [Ruminococcus sp.]|nr:histidine kinase [Ruminococcus sp.]